MTALKLDISEGQVANAIAVALAESFGPDRRDALMRDVIRAHLSVKANSYDRETLLSKTVGDLVRGMAAEAVKAKVETWRPDVERIVGSAMGDNFKEVALNQLSAAMQRVVLSNLSISVAATFDD